jgi:(1->4)-alpha-D-glucan 1-alpha-D-glucosylmutase
MAKGVEDRAFYRWLRLTALNEVGGDPMHLGVTPEEFHGWCARAQRDWPEAMTTLSTHDTKRSEDVRARLFALSELPDRWGRAVSEWRAATAPYRPSLLDANTEYLIWQTLVGVWPLTAPRLVAYLEKATREAKRLTTWTEPNEPYDAAVREFADRLLNDAEVLESVAEFVASIEPVVRANVLGQKLVALTMPGVPDIYQGCDLVDLSLVDPDNRRAVDFEDRRTRLERLDAGRAPADLSDEKLLVVSRALRLRRDHPEWFGAASSYAALETSTPRAVAFARAGSVTTVVSRLTARSPGWDNETAQLPPGPWRDVLTDTGYDGGAVPLAALLAGLPVALLIRA